MKEIIDLMNNTIVLVKIIVVGGAGVVLNQQLGRKLETRSSNHETTPNGSSQLPLNHWNAI